MLHLTPLKSLLLASALALLAATPATAQEKFRVITTFTVIADMAQNVAGDAADVSSITKPGAEIHDYQPTPGDIKRAQGAQLILSLISNGGLPVFISTYRAFRRWWSARGSSRWASARVPIAGSPIPMPGCRQITP